MSEHKLIDGVLKIEDTVSGGKGIIGRCTCGWTTGFRISSAIASVAFRDHQEEQNDKEPKP